MSELINKIVQTAVWPFVIFLFALSALIFIYGLVEFIANADNPEKKEKGKKNIIWGIIGLFIMFSVYGIIQILQSFISSVD